MACQASIMSPRGGENQSQASYLFRGLRPILGLFRSTCCIFTSEIDLFGVLCFSVGRQTEGGIGRDLGL